MKPLEDQSLIDPSLFRPDLVVADTVYNPRETRMIQEAKAAGCEDRRRRYRYAVVAGCGSVQAVHRQGYACAGSPGEVLLLSSRL